MLKLWAAWVSVWNKPEMPTGRGRSRCGWCWQTSFPRWLRMVRDKAWQMQEVLCDCQWGLKNMFLLINSSWFEELIAGKMTVSEREEVTAYWHRENGSHPLGRNNDKSEEVVSTQCCPRPGVRLQSRETSMAAYFSYISHSRKKELGEILHAIS